MQSPRQAPETEQQRDFAVIDVSLTGQVQTLGPDDIRYFILISACNRVIDIMRSARGTTSLRQYILFNLRRPGLHQESPEVTGPTTKFQNIINRRSPLLVLDQRIRNDPTLVAEHPRAPWDGEL